MPDASTDRRVDPVTLALVQNRLDHIARQMGHVMVRTSRSPIFNQSHDFSCFITDRDGTLVSQADGIPIHTGGGGFAVRAILRDFAEDIAEEDVFLLNDPYVAGGNHLPDWVIARPVFVAAELVAFACNRAHQSDIGGGAAGAYNPEATEIFHEGIRLPVLKLVEAGRIRRDLWRLLMINTRCPELLDGDLRAMLGSTRIGAEQIAAVFHDLGRDAAAQCFVAILDHGERRLRQALAALPQGVYRAEESFDNDCFEPADIRIRVAVTLSDAGAIVDFTGTHKQIRGFKNSSLANTHSAVYAAFASFFETNVPRNEGTFRAIRIIAPEGSLVNARPPAPLTMCTVFPAHEIMQACWWALGQADPSRNIAGWGKNAFPVTSGTSENGDTWVAYHWGGGSGGGAVRGRDGFNQMGPMITLGGLVIPNAETWEQLYPVRVQRQEFRCDAAGAGKWRGGTGVNYVVEIDSDATYSFRGEGVGRPTGRGVEGASTGAGGDIAIELRNGETRYPPQYALWRVGPSRLTLSSPGGGGYGDPLEREPALVARDVRDGVVSSRAAQELYGVTIGADGEPDTPATVRERGARRGENGQSSEKRGGMMAKSAKREFGARKFRTLAAASALCLWAAWAGPGLAAEELPVTDKIPASPVKIRVMTYNGAYTSLPPNVAKNLGFYEKYKLDAELIVVNSGPAGVAALLGGSIDFVEPPTDQIIQNQIKGTDLRIVVGNEVRNFYSVIASNKAKLPHADQGFPAVIQDLKGMRLGVNALGATTHLMFNALLKAGGLTPDDVTYLAVGSANTALAAWQADRVDVQMAFTPFPEIIAALGSGKPIVDFSKGQGPAVLQKLGGAFEAFSTKASFIKEHPEIVNAFIKAHVNTISWIKDPANREKLHEQVGKFVNTSVIPEDKRTETLKLMIDNYNQYFGYTVDRGAIDAWNEYLLENKLIPHAVPASDVIYAGAPKP